MGCPYDCDKTSVPADEPVFNYTTTVRSVRGMDGNNYAVDSALVDRSTRPNGGFKAEFPIRGHRKRFDGRTPQEVFDATAAMLRANQIGFSELDLWFNLNIQWLGRVTVGKAKVRQADLLAIADGAAQPAAPRQEARSAPNPATPPAVWGSKGWAMLQMYLAGDKYEFGRFLMLATELAVWVNPDANPSTGCADCFRHFSIALEGLRKRPRHTRADARQWLFGVMNEVNGRRIAKGDARARIWTYDEAAKSNFWY